MGLYFYSGRALPECTILLHSVKYQHAARHQPSPAHFICRSGFAAKIKSGLQPSGITNQESHLLKEKASESTIFQTETLHCTAKNNLHSCNFAMAKITVFLPLALLYVVSYVVFFLKRGRKKWLDLNLISLLGINTRCIFLVTGCLNLDIPRSC